jgi:hypothetical protein
LTARKVLLFDLFFLFSFFFFSFFFFFFFLWWRFFSSHTRLVKLNPLPLSLAFAKTREISLSTFLPLFFFFFLLSLFLFFFFLSFFLFPNLEGDCVELASAVTVNP